jgi:spermidine/putrescine transport system ATP-binding protein
MTDTRPAIELRGINKSFGRVHVVKDLDLEIREGEFFSLLGPSGCGKTTSLRMMAGFEEPDTGSILLRGQDVTNLPPNRRNVNLVFQNYELFPHMSVFDNVAYGLKLRRVAKPEIRRRVEEMLAVVQVAGLGGRGARQLSGGQQQRVALARALVNQPAVLLLDEPLSALDVKLRKQMQVELKSIQHRLGTTFVYVTHDQEEAFLMSDRVGIMNQGRLLQLDAPRAIYERPADAFVADFVGSLNTFDLRIDSVDTGVASMRVSPGERLAVRVEGTSSAGSTVRVAVRPERISFGGDGGAQADNHLAGTISAVDYVGPMTTYRVSTAVGTLLVPQQNDARRADRAVGSAVTLEWPIDAVLVLATIA